MHKYVQNYVIKCDICQKNKGKIVMILGLLHPLHIPNQWEEMPMDFINGLPLLEGKEKILLVMDRLTKYAHFMGMKKIDSAKQIVEIL